MKLTRFLLTLCVSATLLSQLGIPGGKAQALPPASGPAPVVTALADGVSLSWHVPAPHTVLNAAGEAEIRISGFAQVDQPGAARLPYTSILVALPSQAAPRLEIQQSATNDLQLTGPLAVNPAQSVGQIQPAVEPVVLTGSPLRLEEIGTLRGVRLARISFYPVQPQGSQGEWVSQIQATLHFQAPAPQTSAASDPLVSLVQAQVVNPGQVESTLQADSPAQPRIAAPSATGATAILAVTQPGIYQVSYEQLAAAGFPVSQVNPLHLKLTHAGQEVAYEWTSLQNTTFSSGEALRFYAQPTFSRWSTTDSYLLSETSVAGKAIATRSAAVLPGTTTGRAWAEPIFDENQIYTPDCLNCGAIPLSRDGDRWAWSQLDNPAGDYGKSSDWFEFFTNDVDASQSASFTSWWIGRTDVTATPDHMVTVDLNGTSLGSISWDGKTAASNTLSIPAGVLKTGSNVVTFDVPALSGVLIDGVWLDSFKVRYALGSAPVTAGVTFTGEGPASHNYQVALDNATGLQAYDVSSPLAPIHLTGFALSGATLTLGDATGAAAPLYQVVNASGILSPTVTLRRTLTTATETSANYVILAADGYTSALSSLIALRKSQGLKVVVENLQAIYDQYSDGRMDPEAIYAYLKWTYQNWRPAPQYVLLVGDGTVDPKHYRSDSFDTILPAMLKPVHPYAVEIASDNRYVTLDGSGDNLPDMIVGRLPANTPGEAAAMVAKIVQYETAPVAGLWHSTTTFIADNQDSGGDFAAEATRIAQIIPGPFFRPQELLYGVNLTDPNQMHAALMGDWDQGSGLITYVGHSAQVLWAQELFLHVDDLPALTNAQKLPVVLEMTCFTGNFAMNSLSSIDESMVRQPSGGALAAWGSANVGISSGHEYLANGFLKSLTVTHPNQLGLATLAGRLNLVTVGSINQYLIDSYNLFGDPATRTSLKFVPDHLSLLPIARK